MFSQLILVAISASLALGQVSSTDAEGSTIESVTSATDDAAITDAAASEGSETATTSGSGGHTQTVDVGLAGHTFQPDTILADVGDIVEFHFFPTNHSVIRAEYMLPCVPIGMTGRGKTALDLDSGFRPVDAILDEPPVFRVKINNTDPIFYYCGAEGSCINWQMVGVINPNKTTSLAAHKQAAADSSFMLLPGEKWPAESEGENPMHDDEASSTSSADSASSTASNSTGTSSSSSNGLSTGAIAGIAVGGTLVVVGIAGLLFFCGRRSRKNSQKLAQQQQPLMQAHNPGGAFSPNPQHAHMSYMQPYPPSDMNKHFSMQSTALPSPALPGYIPQGHEGMGTPTHPLYGPSDALNPGHNGTDYTGSPAHSPNIMAVGASPAPAYSQRNSMQPGPFSPNTAQPSAFHQPQANVHEMAAAPVSGSQFAPQAGELSGSGAPQSPQQGGGIMSFIQQNSTGDKTR